MHFPVAYMHTVSVHPAIAAGQARASLKIEGPAMKGANDLAFLNKAGAQWRANVRAFVVENVELPALVENRKHPAICLHAPALAILQFSGVQQRHEPLHFFFFHGMSGNLVGSLTGAGFS